MAYIHFNLIIVNVDNADAENAENGTFVYCKKSPILLNICQSHYIRCDVI